MADSTETIAPSTTSPQDPQPDSPPPKRRQPSPSPQSAKRQRLSTGSAESLSTLQESPKPIPQNEHVPKLDCKSSIQEERKRGQRLFGGLLSTLSQSSTGIQQKRRLDIEKKQQEKAKQQKIEDEGRRREKLLLLKEVRTREMVGFEEEAMHLRHSSMLATAQFLQTKTEPKLYYKPWDLLPAEIAQINHQITTAQSKIAQELSQFSSRRAATAAASKTHIPIQQETKPPQTESEKVEQNRTTKGEKDAENPVPALPDSPIIVADSSTNDIPIPLQSSSNSKDYSEGEVVLEAAEDTVIY